MAEYIERDKILEYMDLVVIHARGVSGDDPISKKVTDIVAGMRDIVAMAPAADVAPVVHGEWLKTEEPLGWHDVDCVECSVCHESWIVDEDYGYDFLDFWHYCPNCGAHMKDGE